MNTADRIACTSVQDLLVCAFTIVSSTKRKEEEEGMWGSVPWCSCSPSPPCTEFNSEGLKGVRSGGPEIPQHGTRRGAGAITAPCLLFSTFSWSDQRGMAVQCCMLDRFFPVAHLTMGLPAASKGQGAPSTSTCMRARGQLSSTWLVFVQVAFEDGTAPPARGWRGTPAF